MTYRVEVARSAAREFRALPPGARRRVGSALKRLVEEPRSRGARKLAQGRGWRLRAGDYRVLYTIDDDSHMVIVFAIGHRREAYRL